MLLKFWVDKFIFQWIFLHVKGIYKEKWETQFEGKWIGFEWEWRIGEDREPRENVLHVSAFMVP